MNVLLLSTWFPFPPDSGSRIRIYHLLRSLAERHSVDLITFMPDMEGERFLPKLQKWCRRVDVVRQDPFWRDPSKRFVGHLSLRPRDVVVGYTPLLSDLVREAARHQEYNVVVASFANIARYALEINGPPRLLEEHNFYTAWMEERYRSQTSPFLKIAQWITWQKCRHYERWLYPQFNACTLVSERDRVAVRTNIPHYQGLLEVIPNGVDLERNRPGLAEPTPDTLVFNGALTYYANLDAMKFFIREIFPLIRVKRPFVSLRITGHTTGVMLEELPIVGNVTLTGYLEDVRPMVAGSWACVVPLRVGGGTRLKILEAMALGTPVVSTSKGAEGLDVSPEQDILIADDPQAFRDQILRLLRDANLRQTLSRNGRALVEAKYGWTSIAQRFSEVVEETAARRDFTR